MLMGNDRNLKVTPPSYPNPDYATSSLELRFFLASVMGHPIAHSFAIVPSRGKELKEASFDGLSTNGLLSRLEAAPTGWSWRLFL